MWRVGQTTESAFTLLEVLVVLILISLVGTLAALGLSSMRDRITFAKANIWLDSTLTRLRLQARREGHMTWIDFDPSRQRYRINEEVWRALPLGITWEAEPKYHPGAASRTITFLPDGTGSGGGIHGTSGCLLVHPQY